MNPQTAVDKTRVAVLTILILAAVWLLPPAAHRVLHYCPLRADGTTNANAVPAFARKYGFSCMQCHTSFPTLNAFGRQFKMNGYVTERGSEQGVIKNSDGSYWTEKLFPFSAIIRSRPYDKATGTNPEFRLQPIADVDFFVAGGDAARKFSYFGEIDANSDGTFTPGTGDVQLGYHYNDYLNVIGARRGFFVMDPFQTLSNFGSPTLAARATAGTQITDLPFYAQTLDQTTQTAYLYGEAGNDDRGYLYYAGGVSGDKGDDKGANPKSGNLRLAFDTNKGVVFGAFGSMGNAGPASGGGNPTDRIKYREEGVDLLVEKAGVALRSAFLYDHDRDDGNLNNVLPSTIGSKETNRAAYAELMYVYKRAGDHIPFLVPLVRENWYTTSNGTRQFSYVTAQLAHYFRSNVKAFVEYSGDTKQDRVGANTVRSPKGSRWSGQIELGF